MQKTVNGMSKQTSILQILALILIVASVVIRFSGLSGDVPESFATEDAGYHIDEGYKTLAARNQIVHGRSIWNEADEYEGWYGKSVVTQSLYELAFRIGGLDIASARCITLGLFLLLIGSFWLIFKSQYAIKMLILGLAIWCAEPYLYFYSKVALFELPLALGLAMGFFVLYSFQDRSLFVYLPIFIAIAAASTLLIKGSAFIYALPAIMSLAALEIIRKVNLSMFRLVLYSSCAAVLLGLLLYFTQDIWSRRLGLSSESAYWNRLLTNPAFEWSPLILLLASLCALHGVASKAKAYFENPYRLALLSTLVGVPAILAFLPYGPSRYYVAMMVAPILLVTDYLGAEVYRWKISKSIALPVQVGLCVLAVFAVWMAAWSLDLVVFRTLIPLGDDPGISGATMVKWVFPLALLVGLCLAFFHRIPKVEKWMRISVFGLLMVFLSFGAIQQFRVALKPEYSAETVAERLAEVVPETSSVAGDLAPYFGLRANRDSIYVNHVFNETPEQFRALRPDFFLASGTVYDNDTVASITRENYISKSCSCKLGQFRGKEVILFEVFIEREVQCNNKLFQKYCED